MQGGLLPVWIVLHNTFDQEGCGTGEFSTVALVDLRKYNYFKDSFKILNCQEGHDLTFGGADVTAGLANTNHADALPNLLDSVQRSGKVFSGQLSGV